MKLWALMALSLLAACAPGTESLRQKANAMADQVGMHAAQVQGGDFTFYVLERVTDPAAAVRIYIEGDGNAWLTRDMVSPDPTPRDPTALELAVLDHAPNVVYMARPCQYVMSAQCAAKYWTSAQFSEPVMASINAAMNRWQGHKIELVGYSGGGAVAVLIAASRTDVVSLRTVAGNIDTSVFAALHHVSPLSESLNPVSYAQTIAMIPQLHFIGENDTVVPQAVADSYRSHLPPTNCSAYNIVKHIDHYSGWAEQWPTLLAMPLPCASGSANQNTQPLQTMAVVSAAAIPPSQ